jgi:hypothetical protein
MADRDERVPRILLALTAAPLALVGIWATLTPRGFYDSFPGFGRHWVDVDGPYNEHLVRDVGNLELAVAFVVFAAAIFGGRRLMQIGAVAALLTGVPHVAYHALNRDGYETGDLVASIGGLAVGVVLPAIVLWLTWPEVGEDVGGPPGELEARQ